MFLSNFEAISVVNCESELPKLSERYTSHLFKPAKLIIVTCLKLVKGHKRIFFHLSKFKKSDQVNLLTLLLMQNEQGMVDAQKWTYRTYRNYTSDQFLLWKEYYLTYSEADLGLLQHPRWNTLWKSQSTPSWMLQQS